MTSQSELLRRVEAADSPAQVLREVLGLVEDTANLIAKRTRGMTTATPERRALRESFELAVDTFIRSTATPSAAAAYTQPDETLIRMLRQSPSASASATEPEPAAEQSEAA